jgi:hypothetical protein
LYSHLLAFLFSSSLSSLYQVRIHSTKDSVFHLLVKTGPIIEESSGLQFGVYQPGHPEFVSQIQEAGMETMMNRFKEVQDFNWANPTQPSPHWRLLPPTTATTP